MLHQKNLTPEFNLLIACLQSSLKEPPRHSPLLSIHKTFSWDDFYTLSQRHKVTSLIWSELRNAQDLDIPDHTIQMFKSAASRNTKKAMMLTAEMIKIIAVLNSNNINVMPLKGSTLALKFYGSLGQRHAGDIDLLITDPKMLWQADELVKQMGYKRTQPNFELTPRQKSAYLLGNYDIDYCNQERGIILEIHFAWTRNPNLFPMGITSAWNRTHPFTIANTTISSLDDIDHLHFLVVHGAKHAWERLLWLYDVARIAKQLSNESIANLLESSKKLGTLDMFNQALVLSTIFFDEPIWQTQHRTIGGNAPDVFINRYAIKKITRQNKDMIPTQGVIKKLRYLLHEFSYAFALRTDFRYKQKMLTLTITTQEDWKLLPLPDKLFNLYYVLRPFLWLARQIKK